MAAVKDDDIVGEALRREPAGGHVPACMDKVAVGQRLGDYDNAAGAGALC